MKSFHRRTARPAPVSSARSPAPVDRAGRMRADALVVERGLAVSRAAAQRLIASGVVRANGVTVRKPSLELPADAAIELLDAVQ